MTEDYFQFKSTGEILWNAGNRGKDFVDWWALVLVDSSIVKYNLWSLKKYGLEVKNSGSRYGPHISLCKGEKCNENFGKDYGLVEFEYAGQVRYDDNYIWIDVKSEDMNTIREDLGLGKLKVSFHITLGSFRVKYRKGVLIEERRL